MPAQFACLYSSKRIRMRHTTLRWRWRLIEISLLVTNLSYYLKNVGSLGFLGFRIGLLASTFAFSGTMMHSSTCVANQPRSMFSRLSDGMQVSRYSISCFKRSLTSAVCRTSGVLLRELSSTRSFDVRRLLLTYVSQRTCWGLTNRWVGACWSILPSLKRNLISERPSCVNFWGNR